MDAKLQCPRLTNTWTLPVENRLDMALTGIKTPAGMKLQGTNLEPIQQLGAQVQQILSGLPQGRSVFAGPVSQGFYVNAEVNRADAPKYVLTMADVQQAVESGGMNVSENIEALAHLGRSSDSRMEEISPRETRKGRHSVPERKKRHLVHTARTSS